MIDFDILYDSKQFIQIKPEMYQLLIDYFDKKSGSIYLAISQNNDFIKLGRTGKNPLERAETLSTTGVLHDFEIPFSLPVLNQFWAESMVHKKLKKYRVNKEFFAVNRNFAIQTMTEVYDLEEHLLKRYFKIENLKKNYNNINECLK